YGRTEKELGSSADKAASCNTEKPYISFQDQSEQRTFSLFGRSPPPPLYADLPLFEHDSLTPDSRREEVLVHSWNKSYKNNHHPDIPFGMAETAKSQF